jgi:hypothetical protein
MARNDVSLINTQPSEGLNDEVHERLSRLASVGRKSTGQTVPGAVAYTGSDGPLYFSKGNFDPGMTNDRSLAHELAHVVQQKQG